MAPIKPIVVAHRGLHTKAPENSLGAFTAAASAKIPWVECDVWPSADGIPVVIHDETLDRTTTARGRLADHSWNQLQQLQLPSLADVLALLSGEIGILVEIKPPDAMAFDGTIRSLLKAYPGPWMIQSFHAENVGPTSECALLVESSDRLQSAVDGSWANVHAQHSLVDRKLVEQLHGAGRKIGAWTVNEPADIHRMIDLGIDMLITDEPVIAAKLMAEK